MKNRKIRWKIGGEAGFGIMVTGNTFCRVLTRAGFWTFGYPEYPSLIRGGHNTFQVDVDTSQVFSVGKSIDLLVCLNSETGDIHKEELSEGGLVIFDPEDFRIEKEDFSKKVLFLPVPFLKLSKQVGGDMLMRNTVALGVTLAVLDLDFGYLESVLTDMFRRKGDMIVEKNVSAARSGFDYARKNLKAKSLFNLSRPFLPPNSRMVVTGNESLGLAAIAAGCRFFSAYPMTPINGLLAFMAANASKYGFIYKQPEDEISGINMAIGSSFGGVRAMTATSGGGFSLMVEALGLAGMTEIPLVVVLGQRPGPSSGLPTWTGQGDLQFALNASQGDFPRFVLAPGDPQEVFSLTTEAFNLADIYQTPVIIIVDKFLCESPQTTEVFNYKKVTIDRGKIISKTEFEKMKDYKRYLLTTDGISPRALPGNKGPFFVANSYEHDEYGFSTESAREIKDMAEKRWRKEKLAESKIPAPEVFGSPEADVTFVGWGSTKGPMMAALCELISKKFNINYLHLTYLSPFPTKFVVEVLSKAKRVVDIEGNISGQLARLVREKTGIEIKERFLKYDGRPFFPEEIVEYVKEH